jgi:hypothetical protein
MMEVALYARVSTSQHQQPQTMAHQCSRLRERVAMPSAWQRAAEHIYTDVHQLLLLEERTPQGCAVAFLARPMRTEPHAHLRLPIRGAVAE